MTRVHDIARDPEKATLSQVRLLRSLARLVVKTNISLEPKIAVGVQFLAFAKLSDHKRRSAESKGKKPGAS
jgi:hypothetical protein